MSHSQDAAAEAEPARAAFSELFREGRAVYTVLVLLGVGMHALQTLVIAIVMPTVVADIGGADFYAWPAMLYTIGAITGTAALGPVWNVLGPRRGYAVSGLVFMAATIGCALAPSIGALNVARLLQGFSGGLIIGGGMALVSGHFTEPQRKRVLALHQGAWMICQLMGPVVGGAFAAVGWWRGSFWVLAPVILILVVLAWFKTTDGETGAAPPARSNRFPLLRLMLLSGGVFAVALAGPVFGGVSRVVMIVAAVVLVWACLRLDRHAANRLYPSGALSLFSPVGLGLWVLLLGGMAQTTLNVFMPLLLQVVHGVSPLFVSFIAITVSAGWTIATFAVSGFSGRREDAALRAGPLLMLVGLGGIAYFAQTPHLGILTLAALILGLGVGAHNVLLVTRVMANGRKGEERVTSASIPSMRSLGTAFGAATGGMLASVAGLGDATKPEAVGPAVNFVFTFNLIPLACAALFMFALLRLAQRAGPRD
ncbi:MAG: MFS transporter [Alphaproteobacteria bacterium]|nr:MFS transporter [Alphaproteobacteria bacterium]